MSIIIEEISRQHDRKNFSCGVVELDTFLQKQARQKTSSHISKTYICRSAEDKTEIKGYYTLTGYSVVTPPNKKIYANYPHPLSAVKLARLAVSTNCQGQKIGQRMLLDAILKTTIVASQISTIGLFVDPTSIEIVPYYKQFGFIEADPYDPTRFEMWLPTSTCLELIGS